MSRIKVSVSITTYDHEPYIRDCLEGVVAQQLDQPIEIIVGEDASTDGTRRIVEEFEARHPGLVKPIYHPENVGAHENIARIWDRCQGEYIALLEGDDFWIHPEKLRMQVELLDRHPEYALCFTAVREQHHLLPEASAPSRPLNPKTVFGLDDILMGCFPRFSSVMFRRSMLPRYPDFVRPLPVGDWPVFMELAQQGALAYLDEVTTTYRIHPHGDWSRRNDADKLRALTAVLDGFKPRLDAAQHFKIECSKLYQRLTEERKRKRKLRALLVFLQAVWTWPSNSCHLNLVRSFLKRRLGLVSTGAR